ncbi:hypothetical protein KRMM14A1004_39360 [Krasilnikovia sp. MM14-A1004]
MAWLAWSPLMANLALGLFGPWIARSLPPRAAVRSLPAAMVVVTVGTGIVLAALGFLLLAQVPEVAHLGSWSAHRVGDRPPVPVAVEAAAGVCAVALFGSGSLVAVRVLGELARAAGVCRRLTPGVGGVVVVTDAVPDAYAIGGLPGTAGRIVVTTGLLHTLDDDECRAVLAHEGAHLSDRHHLWTQLTRLVAAANPVLRPTARAVRYAVERAADEAAAGEVGSRRLVAVSLARAALAKAAARRTPADRALGGTRVVLPATDGQIARRAAAMLAPAPRPRRLLGAALLVLTAITFVGSSATADQLDDRLDRAEVPVVVSDPAEAGAHTARLHHGADPSAVMLPTSPAPSR